MGVWMGTANDAGHGHREPLSGVQFTSPDLFCLTCGEAFCVNYPPEAKVFCPTCYGDDLKLPSRAKRRDWKLDAAASKKRGEVLRGPDWSPTVAAVVITRNRARLCHDTVTAMVNNAGYPLKVVVVDGSDVGQSVRDLQITMDATSPWASGKVSLLYQTPHGCGAARNAGIASLLEPPDLLYIADDDVMLAEGWLSKMVEVMRRYPLLGVLGALWVEHVSHHLLAVLPGDNYKLAVRTNQAGFSMLIPWTVWLQCGPFDEAFPRYGYEDTKFCQAVRGRSFWVGHVYPVLGAHLTRPHWMDDARSAKGGREAEKWLK